MSKGGTDKYGLIGCFDQPNPIVAFKQLIAIQTQTIKQRFKPDRSVATLLTAKSRFIDSLLRCCWQHFLGNRADKPGLIATGGYGRSELFPHSDIDILILTDSTDKEALQEQLSNFSRFLWEAPGHDRLLAACGVYLTTRGI